jgi:hypothetical protein
MRLIVPLLFAATVCVGEVHFRAQEIQRDFGIGYAVVISDVNGDHKPDIVAINPTQVVWFENPTWEKHVILMAEPSATTSPSRRRTSTAMASHFAVGATGNPPTRSGGGSLQWIGAKRAVESHSAAEEPTHRIKWGDVDGDGHPS